MKKILFILLLVSIICVSYFTITNTINKSIKKMPENAVLVWKRTFTLWKNQKRFFIYFIMPLRGITRGDYETYKGNL